MQRIMIYWSKVTLCQAMKRQFRFKHRLLKEANLKRMHTVLFQSYIQIKGYNMEDIESS